MKKFRNYKIIYNKLKLNHNKSNLNFWILKTNSKKKKKWIKNNFKKLRANNNNQKLTNNN